MRTAIVSDLHLGALGRADTVSRLDVRERLLESLAAAERVVLLGDLIELRERAVAPLLEFVRPFFEALGEATAGKQVVLLAGNHDHALAEPWLTRRRLEGRPLAAEARWPVPPGDDHGPAGRIARWMPRTELTLAYPGVRLRPDVYATHGHYLDLRLTVPRVESLGASLMGRLTGRGRAGTSAAEYEAVLAPMYAFLGALANSASEGTMARGTHASRLVWSRVNGDGRLGRVLLGRVTIPGAVVALNRLGFGPFSALLTGAELRRAGLLAMAEVAEVLAPGAEHVLFGHTHRPGPLAGDDEAEWTTLSGARLWNSGSWALEPSLMNGAGERSPYWPGTVLWLEAEGSPRVENVLRGVRFDYAAP